MKITLIWASDFLGHRIAKVSIPPKRQRNPLFMLARRNFSRNAISEFFLHNSSFSQWYGYFCFPVELPKMLSSPKRFGKPLSVFAKDKTFLGNLTQAP
jgi:hypothetical protein